MVIYDQITEEDARLLEEYGIIIDEHEYSADELSDIVEILRDAEVDNLINDGNTFSPVAVAYARLHDKIFVFSEAQYEIENPDYV